jgi:hypothetical protein
LIRYYLSEKKKKRQEKKSFFCYTVSPSAARCIKVLKDKRISGIKEDRGEKNKGKEQILL